jgi:hypothetical protein
MVMHFGNVRHFNRSVSRRVLVSFPVRLWLVLESNVLISIPGIGFFEFVVIFWLILMELAWFDILEISKKCRLGDKLKRFRLAGSRDGIVCHQ